MNFTNYFKGERTLSCRPFLLFLLMMFLMSYSIRTKAQTTLSAGDIAFSAYDSENNNDSFGFMLLKNITANTSIVITDGAWSDANSYFKIQSTTTDWLMVWKSTTSMNVGDQVKIWNPATGVNGSTFPAVSAGTITAGRMLNLPTSGDQIFIIQSPTIDSTTNYTISGGTVICGIHTNYVGGATNASNWDDGQYNSTNQNISELPPGLTTGTNCVMFNCISCTGQNNEWDNLRFNCSGTTAADLNDSSKWDKDDGSAFSPTLCTIPIPTWNGTTWSTTPSSGLDAIINSSTTPGAFSCKNLTINSGFTLTLSSGVTATISGDVTNSGNGTSGAGTLRFVGTSQALNGNAFTHSGVIEVATGATLTTNSKLTIANGGSLMHGTSTPNGGGSVSGSITFEKTIGSSTYGWRMFSLPVDTLIDDFNTGLETRCSNSTPTDRRNVYYYDPTNTGVGNFAVGWTQANNTTDDENKAYSIYLDNTTGYHSFSSTVSITGTPNDSTKTFNLQYTYDPASSGTLAPQRGWNQIPNYFPSNLSVFNLINDGNFGSTYKAIHVWDQASSQMIGLNQSSMNTYNNSSTSRFSTIRQIPPFMGFWVKATSTSQSIQLKNAHRTSRTDSLPANTYFKTSSDIFGVTVKDGDNHFDQFTVLFDEAATEGMDYDKDIYKFKSLSNEVPTLYTIIKGSEGDEMLSFNALPVKESYTMPLFIESFKDGKEYTFSPITEEYNDFYDVELVDNKTGVKTMLLTNNYKFNYDAAFKGARFTLNFNKKSTTGIEELYNQEKIWAYTNDGGINVVYKNNNTAAQAVVEVYNIMGQKLYSSSTIQGGETVSYKPVATNSQNNVYIVKVISNGKAQSIKVIY
jgi:hypothetical protein